MQSRNKRKNSMRKVSRLAILANGVQIFCACSILIYAIFSQSFNLPEEAEIALVAIASFIVVWGAVVDIRDALIMRRVEEQNNMLEEAYGQLEDLNGQLRRQRHDFKNHLQVVYTLTEMNAYAEVQDYVQRIYEDVQLVGSFIRTSVPAVNALLSAKAADCREHGIRFEIDIQSSWEDIPVAGWEMCRIIGNFIDNAMDALIENHSTDPCISVTLGETLLSWTLCVENNGPEIPSEHKHRIFQPGFTTKAAGHGNGLSIVHELVKKYGGRLDFASDAQSTRFSCSFPRSDSLNL